MIGNFKMGEPNAEQVAVPLAALLRRVSRDAERLFNLGGSISPIWYLEDAEGRSATIVTPFPADNNAAHYKTALAEIMGDLIVKNNIVRYVWAMEAWAGGGGPKRKEQ